MPDERGRGELLPVRDVFRGVVRTVVPAAERLGPEGWDELESLVEHALAQRPPRLRRQLRLLLRVIDGLALATGLRRFAALEAGPRQRLLGRLESAPLVLLRRGFWGLKTLALLGYYCRSVAPAGIGYRAAPAGWAARS